MTQTQHPVPTAAGSTAESTAERMMRLTGQHVGAGFITRYVLGQLGVWIALMTPAAVTLSLRVGDVDPANKAASLSLIAGLGAACALFANPIFGRLSDKSTSRFGQRRPFILGGVLVGIIATFFLGAATTIPMIAVAWCIAQVGFNTALAATVAVLPERVPAHKRGRVSAWLGSGSQVGAVAGTFLVQGTGTQGVWMFLAPAALALVLVVIFVAGLKEVPRTRAEVGRFRLADIFTALWINPFRFPAFGLAWVGRFLVWTALALLTTYKTYFLSDHLGLPKEALPNLLFISMLALAASVFVSSLLAGWLSDIVKRRKVFVIAASLGYAAAMIVVATATGFDGFLLGVVIGGLSQGAYMGVDYALVSDVLPDSDTEAAKGMGVFNLSSTVPQTVAPVLAPVLLLIGATPGSQNYVALYVGAAVFALLGAAAIAVIRGVR